MSRHRWVVPLTLASMLAACAGGNESRQAASGGQATAATPTAASAGRAGEASRCMEPLPEHPTPGERQAFIREMEGLATRAEEQHGVPAAAVAAMAIQESGYGWTRLAQDTNNLLAWKYTSSEGAGGRESYVLDCPEQGSSDRFVVFRDRGEAVNFVAEQLATSDNYRADTDRYRQDRANRVAVAEAVDRWVDGVADPYSSNPEAYRQAIRRIMNDPYEPSDRRSPDSNLYRLSERARPPQAAGS